MGGLFSDRAKQAFGQAFGDAWGDVERNQELDISVLFGSILAVLCPPGEREIL
ncbi:MAG: hypothetical protein JKY32_16255 [Rhizobiales bacterium]|nr:hypothetical protein [Hyphomicrobiales bacterium]